MHTRLETRRAHTQSHARRASPGIACRTQRLARPTQWAASLAQLAEHMLRKHRVVGSIPTGGSMGHSAYRGGHVQRTNTGLPRTSPRGTWCSGITSASHAEGPGFKSQCVHLSRMACVNCTCVPSATAHLRAFLHVVSELPHPWPRYFPVLAEAHCIKHQVSQRIRKREKRSKSCSVKVVFEYS